MPKPRITRLAPLREEDKLAPVLDRLAKAFNRLTDQLARYNDNHEPVRITGRGAAEVFTATYDRESEERREGKAYLRSLEDHGSTGPAPDEEEARPGQKASRRHR